MLLGTDKVGLLAFDGRRLTPAHPELADVSVTALAGTDADVWIGTLDRGVWRWRAGGVDRFDERSGLPDSRVLSIATSGDRTYVGTALGVAEFVDGRYTRTLAPGLFASAVAVRHDSLLVGTLDASLAEIPLGPRTSRGVRPIVHDAPAPIERFVDADGALYALAEDALYSIDDRTSGLRRVVGAEAGRLTDRNVSALALDTAGRLWVGYFDRGLDILGAQGERAMHVENDHVFCVNRIVHDAAGGMTAVATANGLVLFDSSGRPKQILGRADGLIADHVTDLVLNGGGMTVATPAGLTFIDREGSRSLYAFHGLVNNHVYALGAAGTEVLAGTLGGVSMLENGVIHASYTTANSAPDPQLDHRRRARRRRVVRRNLRRRTLPSGRDGRVAAFFRPVRTDRDQSERDGRDRDACLRRHAVERAAGVRSPRTAVDDDRVRAALDERDRAGRGSGTSVRRHRQRARSHPTMSRLHRLVLLAALVAPIPLLGDVGVLLPSGSSAPDPAILSLDQMAVDIRIDNGDARVAIRQIFASHRGGMLEGEYLFAMPSRATVSDFAVWDDVTRIPGVILERRRAEEIYESLKQQQIDPGLLQQGERGTEGASEATRTSAFSARIVPIPGVRHQAARDRVPRSRAGREPAVGVRAAAASRRVQRAVGGPSSPSRSVCVSAHAIRGLSRRQPGVSAPDRRADAERRHRLVCGPQRELRRGLQRRVLARSRRRPTRSKS